MLAAGRWERRSMLGGFELADPVECANDLTDLGLQAGYGGRNALL